MTVYPRSWLLRAVFLIVFAALASVSAATAQHTDPSKTSSGLFTTSSIDGAQAWSAEPTIVRTRIVDVHLDVLGTANSPADTVGIELFGDVSFTAVFERIERTGLGGFAWIGRLEGVDHGRAVLVANKGLLAGSISMPGSHYEVRSTGNGAHAIHEIDQSAFPPETHGIQSPSPLKGERREAPALVDTCQQIRVLVPYSPEARAAAGGVAAMESLVALAVAETNQSYVNSGLVQRIILAHAMETDPGDASNSFNTDLYALSNLSDGIFDNVDTARETYSADMVGLIIENSSSCGIGFLNSEEDSAFTVTHRTCATGYYSFGHELGHNMSARHDWYIDDAGGSSAYRKGFINLADEWRTIMGYNTLCSDHGVYCNRLPYWSNPNVLYGGDPMGVSSAGPTNCTSGSLSPDPSTCAADNRLALNNTCSTVANFRLGSGESIFVDGFESGNTSAWSSSVP